MLVLTVEQGEQLSARLAEVGYTVSAVVDAIGVPAHGALGRNSTVPARRALAGRDDPLATLTRLWPLQRPVPRAAAERALPALLPTLLDAEWLEINGDEVGALVDLRPYAVDDEDLWVVSDLTPGLDGAVRPMRPDFVLGVSSASSTLGQLISRRPVGRALDLGTGCGVQSLHLAGHVGEIVATDLNPRALELARATLALNGVAADVRPGSLYAPVAGERFDLVVSNPPYVMAPPRPDAERLTYREGSHAADGLVESLVRGAADVLAGDGTLVLLANWAHVAGVPWDERLAGWVPAGCDAHVVQREILDPAAYVELWLADAGLTGSPDYPARYAEWLDYLAAHRIEAVGMGWILLDHSGAADPSLRLEDWPYAVEQPIAAALEAERIAVRRDRTLTDAELLATAWTVDPEVVEECAGVPGAADPEHIVLRGRRGFRRAALADTALAGVVGACDGDLPLGVVVDAVAGLLEIDPDDLRRDLLPRLRRLLVEGMLR